MAKKQKRRTEGATQHNGKQDNSLQPKGRFLIGIVLVVVSAAMLMSILSFLYTGGADRSIFDLSFVDLVINSEIVARNVMGKAGAWFADMVVTNGVGVMSLTIPWMVALVGLKTIGINNLRGLKHFEYCLCSTIWGSVALGTILSGFSEHSYLLWGGTFGHYVSLWLRSAIGTIGTALLMISSLVIYVCMKSERCRVGLVNLLRSVNIKVPQINLSSDEGADMAPILPPEQEDIVRTQPATAGHQQTVAQSTSQQTDVKPQTGADPGNRQPGSAGASGSTSQQDIKEQNSQTQESTGTNVNDNDDGFTITFPSGNDQEDEASDGPDFVINEGVKDDTTTKIHHGLDEKYDPTLDLSRYQFPDIDLLNSYDDSNNETTKEELEHNKEKIIRTLDNFQIRIESITATVGPTVTLYEIVPAPGIRISKIQSLENDIALSLAALGIRIIAPIPGQGTIGIEVPNSKRKIVSIRSCITSKRFQNSDAQLPIAMGKTISGETFVFDLAKTPHLLVAGATGQGKSVGLNAIITSLLYKKHPSQVKFVMIDPKMVEFSMYKSLERHYLAKIESEDEPIIVDIDKVKNTLESLTIEMDQRYALVTKSNERDIIGYNRRFVNRQLNPEDGHRYLPYIVVIIDEFADLIMQAGKEIEMPIARIAQKARAVGIHMILATQRPSVNCITGLIKANFPARIAFKVAGRSDSGTILDCSGAQNLIGMGDMLILLPGGKTSGLTRVQCAFVDTPEVENITNHISTQQAYPTAYELPECVSADNGGAVAGSKETGKLDEKIREIATTVVQSQIGSVSSIQRLFAIGFNRSGRIMIQLERMGIVSAADGSKPRTVLVQTQAELERILKSFGV